MANGDDAGGSARQQIDATVQKKRHAEIQRRDGGFWTSSEQPPGPGFAESAYALAVDTGATGGYKLSLDDLNQQIERFERVADRVKDLRYKWQSAEDAYYRPSEDEVATRCEDTMRSSFLAGREAAEAQYERVAGLIASMKDARRKYVAFEEEGEDTFSGRGVGESVADVFDDVAGRGSSERDTGTLFEKGDSSE